MLFRFHLIFRLFWYVQSTSKFFHYSDMLFSLQPIFQSFWYVVKFPSNFLVILICLSVSILFFGYSDMFSLHPMFQLFWYMYVVQCSVRVHLKYVIEEGMRSVKCQMSFNIKGKITDNEPNTVLIDRVQPAHKYM